MIPQETIDKIFAAANIEEVIGEFVKLDRKGPRYVGLCPFHNEKTPSFTVTPAKGIFKCFGCGAGGNAVTFLMKHQGMSYPEALKYLAKKYGIAIEEKEPTPEEKKAADLRDAIRTFNELATQWFGKQLYAEAGKKALQYIGSRFDASTLKTFRIGYAPGSFTALYTWAKEQGYKDDFLLKTGLFTRSAKNGKLYDFFKDRIIFPVADKAGRIISFSGRILPDAGKDQAKYINLRETPLYHKSNVLYAINFAVSAIAKSKTAILVEGNPDAVKLHQMGIANVVAPSGTALADGQIKILRRFAEKIVLLYDGDKAGQNALRKNGKILVQQGLIPYAAVLPEDEDPESFFEDEEGFRMWLKENRQDFISWYGDRLLSSVGDDPSAKNDAITEITNLLVNLNKTKRELYITEIAKNSGLKAKLFSDKLKEMERTTPAKEEKKEFLPKGIDPNDFEKWGFYAYKNAYHFRTKSGIEKLSNFIMLPIFHVDSIVDSKRIYELINEYGYHAVIDFDMQEMTSIQAFQRNIEGKGNFLFWGSVAHFQKLKLKLYEETRTCKEVKNLGWQKEGYWAWSNGMTDTAGGFHPIDEFGVITHNDQHYFIPAFSKIYINDKSLFIDERKFQFKKRDISLNQWATLFVKVFGDNAKLGIAFWIAAVFRDHLLHIFKNFPLLNLFGPKGTGKSQMAMSLSCLFGEQQTPFNIHNGTKAGLAEHIQQFRNAFAWVDEYKNNLDYDKIETLKSIYDAIGRSRLNWDRGRKKETTEVNSAVIISGQEMPTIDVALFSRMIFLQFHQTEFSKEEKADYDSLKQMERDGLSHLSAGLLKYRGYFEKNFFDNYTEILASFFDENKQNNIEDRILRNMATIAAAFRTLEEKIDLPFKYDDLKTVAYRAMNDQNSQISKSNEVGMFWNLIEALFDDNLLLEKWHFRIDYTDMLKLKNREMKFNNARYVLKFKFNVIYKLYAQQSRVQGIKPLPSDTLQYYLRNAKYFFGIADKTNFTLTEFDKEKNKLVTRKQNTTAYCFDYDQLPINLERIDEETEALNELAQANHQAKKTNGSAHPDDRIESGYVVEQKNNDLPF